MSGELSDGKVISQELHEGTYFTQNDDGSTNLVAETIKHDAYWETLFTNSNGTFVFTIEPKNLMEWPLGTNVTETNPVITLRVPGQEDLILNNEELLNRADTGVWYYTFTIENGKITSATVPVKTEVKTSNVPVQTELPLGIWMVYDDASRYGYILEFTSDGTCKYTIADTIMIDDVYLGGSSNGVFMEGTYTLESSENNVSKIFVNLEDVNIAQYGPGEEIFTLAENWIIQCVDQNLILTKDDGSYISGIDKDLIFRPAVWADNGMLTYK